MKVSKTFCQIELNEEFFLENCPDKTAKLFLSLKFEHVADLSEKEMLKYG